MKKYKRARSITHNSSSFARVTSSTMTTGGLAISLSGVGVILGAPISGVAALFGFVTVAFGIVGRKVSKKISNHEKTISFAKAKHRTMSRLISKAMKDGAISDVEFNLIFNEIEQYHEMKTRERIRRQGERLDEHQGENTQANTQEVNVEDLKEQIKREYQKSWDHS